MQEKQIWSSRNSLTVTASRNNKTIELAEENGRVISSKEQIEYIKQGLLSIPDNEVIHNVLFVGVSGSAIDPVVKKFKDARLTIFEENDNAVAAIFHTKTSSKIKTARIVVQGIKQSLETTKEKFDFIVVNLRKNQLTPELFEQIDKIAHLAVHLLVYGTDTVKGFRKENTTGTLNHFRRINFKVIPDGYVHYRACREFLERESQARERFQTIGYPGCFGQTWSVGPWYFENYFSDLEPEVKPGGPFRMVLWQRIQSEDKPKKWLPFWRNMTTRRTCFVNLAAYGNDYHKYWTPHAQKHRKKWLELEQAREWEIEEVTAEEFIKYYKKSGKDFLLKQIFIDLFYRELAAQRKAVRIRGVRRKGSQILEAGLVTVDIPEAKSSIHLMSFILDSAKSSPATYGLINLWFKDLLERGYNFADFCISWAPGDPKSWQGYSRFKAQFGVQYINYPRPLVRWPGKLRFLP
jgi:hypothetical protein